MSPLPRCPLCRSALVTIGFGLYPAATCRSCGGRWIQDGHQQRAINQVQEPTLFASALTGPGTAGRASTPRVLGSGLLPGEDSPW